MSYELEKASDILKNSKNTIALTGAGISVESGIPDFRSPGGLWEKYDPSVYASIDTFVKKPEMVWEMLFEMIDVVVKAEPNPGHKALAELEKMGLLQGIITQNIDNLHQRAGSNKVIEYHGNSANLLCIKCGKEYGVDDFDLSKKAPPVCSDCNRVLKPSVIFFGETIPYNALKESQELAENADTVLVVGTSAVVYPAAGIPLVAKRNGASVIEFNISHTEFSSGISDVFVHGPSGGTLTELISFIKQD